MGELKNMIRKFYNFFIHKTIIFAIINVLLIHVNDQVVNYIELVGIMLYEL